VNWNGTALVGVDAISGFMGRMPLTRHEIQSFDCHTVPGSSNNGRLSSLLVTVSGIVTHGPASRTDVVAATTKTLDEAPRVFSQSFVLVPEEASPDGLPSDIKYYIAADSLRFVG